MKPFPKPIAPNAAFWESQIPAMRAAAREEYLRVLPDAKRLGKGPGGLKIKRIARGNFPPFFDVQYVVQVFDPKQPNITHTSMSIKTFIKRDDAQRFIDRALNTLTSKPNQKATS